MTMYLSSHDIRPTGCEPAEFIDEPPRALGADSDPVTLEGGDENEATAIDCATTLPRWRPG
jgi:hypothetical protein